MDPAIKTNVGASAVWADRLRKLRTAWVSDAQGSMGVLHEAIKSLVPGAIAAGPAFTVACYPGSIITVHKALAEARAGDVLVVAGDADDRGALMGELMALACSVLGLAGAVIDGAVRDAPGPPRTGFSRLRPFRHAASRHEPKGREHPGAGLMRGRRRTSRRLGARG